MIVGRFMVLVGMRMGLFHHWHPLPLVREELDYAVGSRKENGIVLLILTKSFLFPANSESWQRMG